MIDNYDSFTYNLYALFKKCGVSCDIIKNDTYVPADDYYGIILSPGPSTPENAGTSINYLKNYTGEKPIFGVCLGMQCIAHSQDYGIRKAETVKHGKIDNVSITRDSVLFTNLPRNFEVVRYHSLAADIDEPRATSRSSSDSTAMSYEDFEKKLFGVQFHPESVLGEHGKAIVNNFLRYIQYPFSNNKPVTSQKNRESRGSTREAKTRNTQAGHSSRSRTTETTPIEIFEDMLQGKLSDIQIASLLLAMKYRGETPDELSALASILNRHKRKFDTGGKTCIDSCGTGGDGKSTVNISTAVSIILASMEHSVVKHGNAAQSGKVGSADILTELGFDYTYEGSSAEDFFTRNNYIFLMAPRYHPALKKISGIRKELKVPTIFNFVGPLVNPADPDFQVIGINSRERLELYAETLLAMGKNNITVYSSRDGFDEVSSSDKTECITVKNNSLKHFTLDPSDFFPTFAMPVVGDSSQARDYFISGISGTDNNMVNLFAINTALALHTMNGGDILDLFKQTKEQINSGAVMKKLSSLTGKADVS